MCLGDTGLILQLQLSVYLNILQQIYIYITEQNNTNVERNAVK